MDISILAAALTVIVGVISACIYLTCGKKKVAEASTASPSDSVYGDKKVVRKEKTNKPSGKAKKNEKQSPKVEYNHPWLVSTLRAHVNPVTSFDISPNGKYLVSCALDRSLFIWSIKDITAKDHRSVQSKVEFDSAHLVKFSPDSRSFITCLERGNNIRVFKFTKNEDGNVGKVQQAVEDFPSTMTNLITNIGIDTAGNYIMTADATTKIDILSIKGEKLHTIDSGTMKHYDVCISPCGRFVAASGFTPDVKVWEIVFDKSKTFSGAKKAFELKGHAAGVLALAFSADSSRMATVSKDGTWKLWKVDVEYSLGQDPYLIKSGPIAGVSDKVTVKVALSNGGRAMAIVISNSITLVNCVEVKVDEVLTDVYKSDIRHLMYSLDGRYLYCCGDRNIKVFHNVTGYRAKVADFTNQLTTCTKTMERRIRDQLSEAKSALVALGF